MKRQSMPVFRHHYYLPLQLHKLPLVLNAKVPDSLFLQLQPYSVAFGHKMDLLWEGIIELIFLMQL